LTNKRLLFGHDEAIVNSIRTLLSGRDLPLYRIMSYQFGWVNEDGREQTSNGFPLVHGELCMEVAKALSARREVALSHAAAIELSHKFWQVHVDVADGNPDRNGRPSVWWTWGPAQAINAGDGMHAMARLALFKLRDLGVHSEQIAASVGVLDAAIVLLCEGEYLEISFQERPVVAIDNYLEMAERRSGALMGCASRLGVRAAQLDDSIIGDGLQAFGSHLGLVRHIVDDYALFWGLGERDQTQQGRLQSKKKTLPVVHALTHGGATTKRRIGEIYMKRILEPTDADHLSELLDEAGSRQFTLDTANRFHSKASQALIDLGLNDSGSGLKSALGELAEVPKS